ncbi:hypothetical protein Trydic_g2402 [Trypoxylus dichotomus]
MKLLVVFVLFLIDTFQDSRVNILHLQRLHSRFPPEPYKDTTRYGVARIIGFIKKEKASGIPTLYFDTMDWFGGGLWFSIHRWKICAALIKLVETDAITLGCIDVADGPKGIREQNYYNFLLRANKTVVIANVDLTKEPIFEPFFEKSKIIKAGNVTIGVTAFMTVLLNIAIDPDMVFTPEAPAVQAEVDKLKRQNADFIVVLSHMPLYHMDKELVGNTTGIDLVVGGHSDLFFYNGQPPDNRQVDGPYPSFLNDSTGRSVMFINCGRFGRYVGKLELTFDDNGKLTNIAGNPVHMDESIEEDPETMEVLKTFQPEIDVAQSKKVAQLSVVLNGSCLGRECNLGNLVADSYIEYRASLYKGKYWSDTAVAMVHSNSILGDIIPDPKKNNTITMADVYTVLPHVSTLATVKVTGATFRKMLEHRVGDLVNVPGKFVQTSGIQAEYNLGRPFYQRLVSARIRCQECEIPEYFPLADDEVYNIIMTRFLADGGHGYHMIKNETISKILEPISEIEMRIQSHFDTEPYENQTRYGIARIIHFVKSEKSSGIPTLFFDTMDWFTGTIWYTIHRWKICASLMQIYPVDCITIGCNDLTDGPPGVREQNYLHFLQTANKTILCCNCDLNTDPRFKPFVEMSRTIDISGLRVGITGYMNIMANRALNINLTFTNEIEALQKVINKLKSEDTTIIVILSHGGYKRDLEIIEATEGYDIVIGGHDRKLFYNGRTPISIKNEGKYPTLIKNKRGKDVLLVNAGWAGRFVGKLELTFDDNGNLTNYFGNPVHMDETIGLDEEAIRKLKFFEPEIIEAKTKPVGKSRTYLDSSCRGQECNMGNLITDTFIDYRASLYQGKYWTDTAIAIINAGSMRADIAPVNDTFTFADIVTALPYSTELMIAKLHGKILRKALEYSVSDMEKIPGKFLQVSGMQVQYNLAYPPYQRITFLQVRCQECDVPSYSELVDDDVYIIAAPRFILDGGQGYYMFRNETLEKEVVDITNGELLTRYLKTHLVVQPGTEERILITNESASLRSSQSAELSRRKKLLLHGKAKNNGTIITERLEKIDITPEPRGLVTSSKRKKGWVIDTVNALHAPDETEKKRRPKQTEAHALNRGKKKGGISSALAAEQNTNDILRLYSTAGSEQNAIKNGRTT